MPFFVANMKNAQNLSRLGTKPPPTQSQNDGCDADGDITKKIQHQVDSSCPGVSMDHWFQREDDLWLSEEFLENKGTFKEEAPISTND